MTFKQRLLETLKRLLTSAKVLTLLVGIIVTQAAKHGIILDPSSVNELVVLFSSLLVAQGAADFGVRKAEVEAVNPKPDQVNIQNVAAPLPVAEDERDTGRLDR